MRRISTAAALRALRRLPARPGLWCVCLGLLAALEGGCALERVSEDPGAGGEAGQGGEVTVERFLTVEAPPSVAPATPFAVLVALTQELVTPETGLEPSRFELPEGDSWPIEVVLTAAGFDFGDGVNRATIELPRDGDSEIARFDLTAREIAGERLESRLFATFWFEGRFLARAARPISIVRAGTSEAVDVADAGAAEEAEAGSGETEPTPGDGVGLDLTRDGADLTIVIEGRTLLLTARGHAVPLLHEVEPLTAQQRADLLELYAELADAATRRDLGEPATEVDAGAVAVDVGRQLWTRLAPAEVRGAFWQLAETMGEAFDSIQIYSDDPTIPWELMRPWREDPPEERGFVGLEFDIARGLLDPDRRTFSRAPARLSLQELVVLRPLYDDPLPGTERELEALLGFSPLAASVRSARYDELATVVRALPAGILHFAGHGIAQDDVGTGPRYSILLEDRPVGLRELSGLLPIPPGPGRPFVFFNACSVGRTDQAFEFADGWAPTFLRAGASGYVGTLWPVGDLAAAEFAERFYELMEAELVAGGTAPAELLRRARQRFLELPDPTYLAYVMYGETDLWLTLPGR